MNATTTSPVEIRHYRNVTAFQADAGPMAAAGWFVQAQSTSRRSNAGRVIVFGVLGLVLGLLFLGYIGAVVFGVLGGAIGAAGGGETIVVTYRFQHEAPSPPR